MTKRNVLITIQTQRQAIRPPSRGFVDDEYDEEDFPLEEPEPDPSSDGDDTSELLMEGRLVTTTHRVELVYQESELTGMEGSTTAIGFDRACPEVISMTRSGMVRTGMVFEAGKRHVCIYHTLFSDFEVCIRTFRVENRILKEGKLYLDYLMEIHGTQTERCRMTVTLRNDDSATMLS